MKKKIIAVVLVLLVVGGAIAFYSTRYRNDSGDAEILFRQHVSSVAYENELKDAIAQTELYNVINDHFNSKFPKGKTEKKAIVIGYDGCRADILNEMVPENSAITALVNEGATLKLAYCGGVNYPEKNTQDTSTAPGWCSILTGVWADKHGITGNDITKKMEYKTLLTSLTEDKVIDSATFITKWAGHFSRDNATYLEEKQYCEDNKLNVSFNKLKNDKASHQFTMEEVNKEDCSDFIFVIYEPTDGTGHSKGFSYNNPKYKKAFQTQEAYGLEVINAIKSRATYDTEDWLFIITSDHGGIGTGHGGASIQERMTFIAVNKDM